MSLRFASASEETYHFPLLIRHLLATALTTSSAQEIVYRDTSSFTYAEFVGRVGNLAAMLSDLGVEQGTTVAVMDWDSHRYLEAYFAVPMMGAVLQTVNIRLPEHQLAYTLQHAQAEVILVHHDFAPLIDMILTSIKGVKAIVVMMDGADDALPAWACGEYESLLADAGDFAFEDFDENAVATIFYTTGTTGKPKGVSFTHRQLVLHTLAATGPFGSNAEPPLLGFGDVYMPLTPMFHVHAWGSPYVATMLGLKQVYPGRYEADLICRLRSTHKVSYSHGVPTILQMILDAADAGGHRLDGWKMIIGGSALTKALCAEGRRRGMRVAAGYGMSESAPTLCITRPRHPEDEGEELLDALTASGVPAPLVQLRIVDEAMIDVPHDGRSRGELIARAPWLTPSYVDDANASADLWRGGWLHTQDIATIDETGQVRIRDRLKDVIKTGGEWIDSIQLEELVASADGVRAASVIGVPDPHWGERPLAVVVPLPGHRPSLAELNAPIEKAIGEGILSRYARLDQMAVLDELPKTSVGKIDKKALRALFAEVSIATRQGAAAL